MIDTCHPSSSAALFINPAPSSSSREKLTGQRGRAEMGKRTEILVALILLSYGFVGMVSGYREEDEDWRREREERGRETEDWFLLQERKHVVKTEAGEMKVLRGATSRILDRPMHIGFITMEPRSLFIPQYLDSSLIVFIRRGEAKMGFIYRDELAERQLKSGDVYRIPAGSAFYLVNTGEGQRLEVICSIDASESLRVGPFQSFFIAGGTYPTSILSGFDPDTLSTAFNVSYQDMKKMLTRQQDGPIVYVDSHSPSVWQKFLQLKEEDRLKQLNNKAEFDEDSEQEDEETTWTWRKLLVSVFGKDKRGDKKTKTGKSPDSYNIYDRRPDFRNNYGSSVAIDDSDYSPLKHSEIGIYHVNLTAGSMMAPHVNPVATEYGVVLKGSGRIQIVFPNGSLAMNAEVKEGDVFLIPRYFPFCQIASTTGPFEFFGFTTSARKNRPQFLVGASSVLQTLRGPELAAAFGVSEESMNSFLDAQREAVILPSAEVAPPHKEKGKEEKERKEKTSMENELEKLPKLIENVVMGFD